MIATRTIASLTAKVAARATRVFERWIDAMSEARMRRIRRDIELHRNFSSFRDATGISDFNQHDLQARS